MVRVSRKTLSLSIIKIYSIQMRFYVPILQRVPDKIFQDNKNNHKSLRMQCWKLTIAGQDYRPKNSEIKLEIHKTKLKSK